jgi:hypothetical protein
LALQNNCKDFLAKIKKKRLKMPIPIRPSDYGATKSDNNDMGLDILSLLGGGLIATAGDANDSEADMLFRLWNDCKMVRQGTAPIEITYAAPSGFSTQQLNRLANRGLIQVDTNGIRFTSRAARVIRTMVLGESNVFSKNSQRKPYSLILAESKPTMRKGGAKTAEAKTPMVLCVTSSSLVVEAAKVEFPNGLEWWCHNDRVMYQDGNSDKEYNVRVYVDPMGGYQVWTFHGRRNGTMTPNLVGHYQDKVQALWAANGLIYKKTSFSHHTPYKRARAYGEPDINHDLPGKDLSDTTALRDDSGADGVKQTPTPKKSPKTSPQKPSTPTPYTISPTPSSSPDPEKPKQLSKEDKQLAADLAKLDFEEDEGEGNVLAISSRQLSKQASSNHKVTFETNKNGEEVVKCSCGKRETKKPEDSEKFWQLTVQIFMSFHTNVGLTLPPTFSVDTVSVPNGIKNVVVPSYIPHNGNTQVNTDTSATALAWQIYIKFWWGCDYVNVWTDYDKWFIEMTDKDKTTTVSDTTIFQAVSKLPNFERSLTPIYPKSKTVDTNSIAPHNKLSKKDKELARYLAQLDTNSSEDKDDNNVLASRK